MGKVKEKLLCYHCGDDCRDESIFIDEKYFCCEGCKLVYDILQENNLCTFYTLNSNPGLKQNIALSSNRFSFLEDESIRRKLINFKDKQNSYITFYIPNMHCSSCIWLLENMHRIDKGVISSRVDFLKKEASVVFDETQTSLRKIVEQLANIGYEPSIHLDSLERKKKKVKNKGRIYRIGVAGFCLGNIMMLSFPEYFSGGTIIEPGLKIFFSYVIFLLAMPVFFFSSSEFLKSAWNGIKQRSMNIDIPIALGITAMFLRSSYEIISHTGPGYFDSMSGLVFFMLAGRNFQDFTFDSLSFERDYKSYFPVAVSSIKNGVEKSISVYNLAVNDKFIVRCNEIIPVDAVLLSGNAKIDYSFVTGEASPIEIKPGEMIFAGGKQTGSIIELQVLKEVSQSHLTQLWNRQISEPVKNNFQKYVSLFSRWFIIITLSIAAIAALFWIGTDFHLALNAFTAVLVISCPCAFTLSAPFTFGNSLRILGKNKIYLKNNTVIEKLADVDTIVFDKTGTLTVNNSREFSYSGEELTLLDQQLIYSLAGQSSHPLSKRLTKVFDGMKLMRVSDYREHTGSGTLGIINGTEVRLGSASFADINLKSKVNASDSNAAKVYVSIDGVAKGYFSFGNQYRPHIKSLIKNLRTKNYKLCVLSGDNNSEEENLREIFGQNSELLFQQSPYDKLNFIKELQSQGKKVMMIGDGLNDAGALQQSNAGFSISDDTNNFSPASDGIIDASRINSIPSILKYSKSAINIITWSFILSLGYNFIGLYYAVQGTLSPVIAAILMPISTVSLVLFTVIASSIKGKRFSNRN